MRVYECACGQPIFFDNLRCLDCGSALGFDPRTQVLGPLDGTLRRCAQRDAAAACNWLLAPGDPGPDCVACRTTRTIPNLGRPGNAQRLRELETSKRRVLFNLLGLRLPVASKEEDPERGLAFDFLETLDGQPPVMTGHADGVITLNVAEADDEYRERHRNSLFEPYRTVIGHLRHELGHYYWDRLIDGTPWHAPCREIFGDERADYNAALLRHYREGPPPGWRGRFISGYAAAHPWEDWAESWAHYLHLRATLETVADFGLDTTAVALRFTPFEADALHGGPVEAGETFLAWINAWVVLTTVLNETARSMGQPDIYPFVMNKPAVIKLHFVHRVATGDDPAATPPPPGTLQVPGA